MEVARQLLAEFGNVSGLARASVAELARIKGVGPAKAVQLAAAFGLASRLARENFERRTVETPAQVWDLLGAEMRALQTEALRVILLDTKLKLLRVVEVFRGSLNECLAHPREIFRPAVLHSAYALIVVHNHPSGDPTPSDADRKLTIRLREAAELMQIKLVDHIILGSGDGGRLPWFSFREVGML